MSRKLGQHFLIKRSAIQKIIAALELNAGETIVEIGPGKGALTIPLAEQCAKIGCKVIGIEKDPRLAEDLEFRIQNLGNAKIIHGDALKVLANPEFYILYSGFFKVVGNIPYYITGKLLRILSELENKPALTVLTIQREVAERICAHPPKMNPTRRKCPMCGMNLLAAAVQFWAEPKIISYLKPSNFSPPPKVESAIIKLATRVQPLTTREAEKNYYKLIKIIFKQPRKTLLNNLTSGLPSVALAKGGLSVDKSKIAEILAKNGLPVNTRPQDLSLEKLSTLSHFFSL